MFFKKNLNRIYKEPGVSKWSRTVQKQYGMKDGWTESI